MPYLISIFGLIYVFLLYMIIPWKEEAYCKRIQEHHPGYSTVKVILSTLFSGLMYTKEEKGQRGFLHYKS